MYQNLQVMPDKRNMAWQFLLMASVAGTAWYGITITHWTLPTGWDRDICRIRPGLPWQIAELLQTAGMWLLMMLAMMMPTVVPWVLAINRRMAAVFGASSSPAMAPWFLGGYFAAWALFSSLVSVLQWQLATRSLLTPELAIGNNSLAGIVFLLVGIYQWTPLKDACLKHCASPATFFLTHWRDGKTGVLWMGMQHGLYCVGCCWLLMLFMLVVGAMNLTWMGLLSGYVLLEMHLPGLRWVSRVIGVLACVLGVLRLSAL
jgi:predicted metal-binding membrane protein